MRFVTCLDYSKLLELIERDELSNNTLFDIHTEHLIQLKTFLEDLNGDISSINVGLFIPNDYGNLSEIWHKIAKVLPVKSGDAVFQFNVNEDECLFFEFNKFLSSVYEGNPSIEECVEFAPSSMGLVVCDTLSIKSFDCAYVVDSKWNNNPLEGSINGSLINSIIELNSSEVWRS